MGACEACERCSFWRLKSKRKSKKWSECKAHVLLHCSLIINIYCLVLKFWNSSFTKHRSRPNALLAAFSSQTASSVFSAQTRPIASSSVKTIFLEIYIIFFILFFYYLNFYNHFKCKNI